MKVQTIIKMHVQNYVQHTITYTSDSCDCTEMVHGKLAIGSYKNKVNRKGTAQ